VNRITFPYARDDGNAREAVKALIVANLLLETDLEKLKAAVDGLRARKAV
jgi:hypothetical protein